MKSSNLVRVVTVGLMTLAAWSLADEPAAPIKVTENDEGFQFTEGDTKVLFYQRKPKSLDGKYERANYVHPLYDLDGEVLTEDFPADHPHHRGIYWAWHQLWVGDKKIGDGWAAKDFSWDVRDATVDQTGSDSASLKVKVLWKSPQWKNDKGEERPLVNETTVIRVHRAVGDARKVDFEISLLAAEKDVRLGGSEDDKGYGGFSTRIRLPKGVRFHGTKGEVAPKRVAVEAGPWLDMSASFGKSGKKSGLTILCHPSLPGFPQGWILRRRNSMQNPQFPGREAVALTTDKPIVLRYRLVLHLGDAQAEKIELWQKEYAATNR